jgi:hypothetical protein
LIDWQTIRVLKESDERRSSMFGQRLPSRALVGFPFIRFCFGVDSTFDEKLAKCGDDCPIECENIVRIGQECVIWTFQVPFDCLVRAKAVVVILDDFPLHDPGQASRQFLFLSDGPSAAAT